jgi:hypothetical protein
MTKEQMRTLNKEQLAKLKSNENKQYTEIEFGIGSNLEDCVNRLTRDEHRLLKGTFNGHTFYSDTVTMDSAYMTVMGKTKAELDEDNRKLRENTIKKRDHTRTMFLN